MAAQVIRCVTNENRRDYYYKEEGSAITFDYIPQSVIDGTCELEAGKRWQKNTTEAGEPCLFGIKDGVVEAFLTQRGFRDIENMTSEDYKKAYFHGRTRAGS